MTKEQDVFNHLYELGCCKYCCLRYLCIRTQENYTNLEKNKLDLKSLVITEEENNEEEKTVKKSKITPCIVCLGLLQEFCLDATVEQVALSEEVKSYDSLNFTCSVSYPACISIREHSIRLHLQKEFPDFFTYERAETQLNKVWKWIIKNKLAAKINKEFESSETCDFSINITMSYEQDTEELSVLLKMQPEIFSTRAVQHKKFRGELYSRKCVLNALEQTKQGIFRQYASVPPLPSTQHLTCSQIQCTHNSIYIAGRYCKYSRELSQTPWIVNGVKAMESSVQDIIFEPIQKLFSIPEDCLKFSSSGREDVDVRCLGSGRPFVLEYLNPKKTLFSYDELRQAENEINKSPVVKIRDLQIVSRDDLVHIKDGEESKTKDYQALCVCNVPVTEEMIKKINEYGPVELQQKTPIRVLHRRPLALRQRTIHSMSAQAIPEKPNFFKLNLKTQAGTYVKEFVHGDFQRTKPCIGTIIDAEVDIIALDVIAINLDWPKPVQYT